MKLDNDIALSAGVGALAALALHQLFVGKWIAQLRAKMVKKTSEVKR